MKASAESRKVSLLLKMVREKTLIPKPDFQRRTVWTNPDKVAFIQTILSGFPFPEIYIAASSVDTTTGEALEVLVDGQQRMRTINDYFVGAPPFKTSRSIAKYHDLTEDQKKAFLNYDVAVRNLGLLDDDTIREIFRRMNSTSYDLNEMERYNAAYLGEFKKLSEELAEHPLLRRSKLFSSNDIRRMKDVSYVASLISTMLSTYFNRDDEIETYLSQYNETFAKKREIRARFVATMSYIDDLNLPSDSRAWRKIDFYNLFIEIDRQLFGRKNRPDLLAARGQLLALYGSVENFDLFSRSDDHDYVEKYLFATLRNTNDRSQRINRGEVVRALLEQVPGEPFEIEVPELDIPIRELDDDDTDGAGGTQDEVPLFRSDE